jgi:hypothetical protein
VCVHAMFKDFMEYMLALLKQADTWRTTTKQKFSIIILGLSLWANYTDQAAAACQRS